MRLLFSGVASKRFSIRSRSARRSLAGSSRKRSMRLASARRLDRKGERIDRRLDRRDRRP